jgi:hypothetical protein
MASKASLTVTPLRFRAVTSSPSGKCRSIFLTGGLVKNFLRASLSSSEAGEVLSFLICWSGCQFGIVMAERNTYGEEGEGRRLIRKKENIPIESLRLLCDLQLLPFLLYVSVVYGWPHAQVKQSSIEPARSSYHEWQHQCGTEEETTENKRT